MEKLQVLEISARLVLLRGRRTRLGSRVLTTSGRSTSERWRKQDTETRESRAKVTSRTKGRDGTILSEIQNVSVPVPEPEPSVVSILVLNLKIVVVDEIVGRLITVGSPAHLED